MNITRGKAVLFHYTLKTGKGEILESTQDSEPMAYLHGYRNIIDSLEAVLEGRRAGDKYTADISAKDKPGPGENADGDSPPAFAENLTIEIEILQVRDATPAERAHGHAHGTGGHHC